MNFRKAEQGLQKGLRRVGAAEGGLRRAEEGLKKGLRRA